MKNITLNSGFMFKTVLFGVFSLISGQIAAQTTLISPSGDGGFENGSSFAANGWTVVNGAGVTNQWFVGSPPALFPTNSAYVSNDPAGATHNYNNTAGSLVHFYKDIILPAGETQLTYSYEWYCGGESTWDFVQVSIGPATITPVAQSGITGGVNPITTPLIPGTIVIGAHNLQGASVQTFSGSASSAVLGNCSASVAVRVFITWRNDGSGGVQPPAAIDNISLVSEVPVVSPLAGIYSVGPGGDFATLTAAVGAVNISGVSAPVFLELLPAYTSGGETFPITLGGQGSCNSLNMTNTVTIRPAAGATGLLIQSANAGPTIDFNTGNWWRIDGRPGGAGSAKELTVWNTATGGQAIRFINDASNNIVRNTLVRGVNTSTVSGVVLFSTTGFANGNDNNLITECDIFDGATSPVHCIYASGTTTNLSQYNNSNTISNCNIYNYFSAASTHSGITLAGGNSDWTISGNSFYQTASRTTTATIHAFQSNSSLNNNITFTGNFIGGSAPNCGGSPMTYLNGPIFRGILVTVGTTSASNFNNNTFRNIAVTTTSTSAAQSLISLLTGRINCNNNTIGVQDGNDNIVFTLSGSAARLQAILAGTGTPELTTINNNTIGGMALVISGAPATVPAFFPISVQGTTVGHNFTVNGNTIGSATTANSVTSNANSSLIGIISFSGALGQTYNNNLLANLTNTNTGTGVTAAGMQLQGSGTAPALLGWFTANGNTIRNISSASTATFVSSYGISVSGTAEPTSGSTITNNTIHSLSNTSPGATVSLAGMLATVPTVVASNISGNNIHSISISSTSATSAIRGFILNGGVVQFANNFIRLGINPDGSSITTSYLIQGILENTGTVGRLNHNSIYIGGSGVSTGASNSFALASVSTAAGRDHRNNILVNARSNAGGTGKHYGVSLAGATPNPPGIISDYNLIAATGTNGFVGLYNAVDRTTLADWRAATGLDHNSITGDPQFIDPTGPAASVDLHISAANPTPIEGGGVTIAAVTTDIDGQMRSAFSPVDIGADAGGFIAQDISGPGIAYTPLGNACGTGNIFINGAVITDATGIPLAGSLIPRVYYRKNMGAWFSQPGSLVSGTPQSSIWNFTIVVADIGGIVPADVVEYYVIAQDIAATPNIASVPGGVSAADVNTINAHPAVPSSTTVLPSLNGTYTVGASGDFTTLTAAVNAYNTNCLEGPVVFLLTDNAYPAETFPITINANAFASSVNTLTIRPAAGATPVVSGSTATGQGLIRLNGADWVILDGSNTVGGTTRDLTINNTSTATNTAVIWVSSVNPTNGATNNTIRNTNIIGGSNTTTSTFGIHISGQTITTTSTGDNNNNNQIANNAISRSYYGIYAAAGSASTSYTNLVIEENSIGSDAGATEQIGQRGIQLQQVDNAQVVGNTIFNIIGSTPINPTGIFLGTGVRNSAILANDIRSIRYTGTGGYGGKGIDVQSNLPAVNLLIANNFISDISGDGWSAFTSDAIIGIRLGTGTAQGSINVFNNSIHLFGPADRSGTLTVSAALYIGSGSTNISVRNNILINTLVNNLNPAAKAFAINTAAPAAFATINHNDYVVSGPQGITGFLNSDRLTLTDWQAATGQDANSIAIAPVFFSNTDLHLVSAQNLCLDGAGTPLAVVTTDFDGEARDANTPDIGADEFVHDPINIAIAEDSGLSPNDGIICELDEVTLTAEGGVSYVWSTGFNGNPLVVNPVGLGDVTYTVTVTDANGCTAVSSVTITVNELPFIQAMTGGGFYCSPGAGVEVGDRKSVV